MALNQSPAIPKWYALLIEAVTMPGLIMKAYRAFHAYSTGNQILALAQCQMRGLQAGPINTFPKWKDLGRFVKRGERALTLCMPITCKRREESSDEEHAFTSFVYKARWFVLSQTDGQELEPITIPEWDAEKAIDTDTGEDLARVVREFYIQDFSDWMNNASFILSLEKLLASLKRERIRFRRKRKPSFGKSAT